MRSNHLWIRLGIIAGLIGSLALTGMAFAQAGVVVRVDPVSSTVAPGQTVDVSIKVDNVNNLAGAEIHLAFNPAVLEVVDADANTSGVQIKNGGMLSPDFVATNQADNSAGTIDYGISQLNKPGVNGNGTLAVITFTGKASGSSPVTFRAIQSAPSGVNLADAGGSPIATTTQSGSVGVTTGPTPTPGGPTLTPGPTRTPTPTPTPGSGTPGKHTVRAGETLFCVGRAYGVSPWAIAMVNRIFAPYWLFVGQVLTIPNVAWTNLPAGRTCPRQFSGTPPSPVTPTPGPTPTTAPGCRAMYTVVAGDTLSAIARKFNVDLYVLASRNNIFNINLIFVGQVLCIP